MKLYWNKLLLLKQVIAFSTSYQRIRQQQVLNQEFDKQKGKIVSFARRAQVDSRPGAQNTGWRIFTSYAN